MRSRAKAVARAIINWGARRLCESEFRKQKFTRFTERPVEYEFVFRKLSQLYPRAVLDVGTGTSALPHLMRSCGCLVTATDNVRDYWPKGMSNRHYHVIDDDITHTRLTEAFDLITCVSVLEHIEDSSAAVRNMFRLLNPDGHLLMTFPYNEKTYVHNVYDLPGSSYRPKAGYITQAYSRANLVQWLAENHAVIADQEYWQFWEGEHWTVGRQILPPRKVGPEDRHQLTCLLVRRGS
ncbi:MAG: class I SAM-dependent methyltransferase [Kiritimatiellae bacterium]|nr:class I SAM-dependent methyltransferase [Kiritimatiellia bacterium]